MVTLCETWYNINDIHMVTLCSLPSTCQVHQAIHDMITSTNMCQSGTDPCKVIKLYLMLKKDLINLPVL